MATITIEIRDCQIKSSPNCTGTFQRELKRGRPPVACPACREVAKVVRVAPIRSAEVFTEQANLTRECPCGNTFEIKAGRGRKASKCSDCRTAGTVYRTDDDGLMQAIQRDQIEREETERKIEAGRLRAENLFNMMGPLLRRTDRVVITH